MISPQGYSLGEEPKSKNPFWGEGEDADVNMIYAAAEISGGHGTPSVQVTKTISGHDITFGFLFRNLVGAEGESPEVTITDITGGHRVTITDKDGSHTFNVMDGGKGDDGVSPDVSVQNIIGGHVITITDATGSESFTVLDGQAGQDGTTPEVTITATQGGETVPVTKTGSGASQSFDFAFPGGGGGASGNVGWGPEGPATNIYPQINSTNKITTEAYSEAITGQTVSLQDASWTYYYATADITVSVSTDTLVQKASSLKNAPQDLNNMSNWTVTDGFNIVVDSLTDNTSTYTFSNITATIGYLNEDGQGGINGMSIKIAADASDGTNTIHVEGNMFANFAGTVGYRTTQTSQNLEVLTQ